MKLSVIVPVYNEKEAVAQCLDAILRQDYPEENYEVIVIDDGSTDGTKEVAGRYPVRLISLENNMGRIVARETGARAAKHDLLLFVDSRYIIKGRDFFQKIFEIGYQPLFPVASEEKYGSSFNTLFYLMRKKWYRPYYPFDNYPREFWIEEENFDKVPKGMSVIVIDKSLYLSSLPDARGKMVNDDTKLLREIVKKKKILRHSDIKVRYQQRTGVREVMKHIYERGPRFADYYLGKGGKYRKLYSGMIAAALALLVTALFIPQIIYFGIGVLLLAHIMISVWFSEDIRDFLIVLLSLPPVGFAFAMGILRGMLPSKGRPGIS